MMNAENSPTAPNTSDLAAAAERILTWKNPILLSHVRPDGDALGCLLGLRSMLLGRGCTATPVLYEPCPRRYAYLGGADALHVLSGNNDAVLKRADGAIVLDTCAWSQLEPVADWLRSATIPKIAIDHHITRDDVADDYLIDETATAASLLVYRLGRAAGWALPRDAAQALFVGLTTDCGWFRYSNTSPEALRVAAELIEAGVDLDAEYQRLFLTDTPAMLRARAAALGAIQLHDADRVAIIPVSAALLESANAKAADLEEVVGAPLSVADVEVSVLLVEMPDGVVKCSFRSKGAVDVAAVAGHLGGGGHARAAGARVSLDLESAVQTVVDQINHLRGAK